MSKYVQHRSGDGEKWKLRDCGYNNSNHKTWVIDTDFSISTNCMELPRSEYVECSPPEEWEDVTVECDWGNAGEGMEAIIFHQGLRLLADRGYRLRKIKDMYNISYFIVERRKS